MNDVLLIVEDDHDVREDLAYLLERKGYAVLTASNGREALERVSEIGRPCLILLDLMMPVMDGWEFHAELSRDPGVADVPVIVLSGIADIEQQAKQIAARDFVTKPIDLDRLYQLVATYC